MFKVGDRVKRVSTPLNFVDIGEIHTLVEYCEDELGYIDRTGEKRCIIPERWELVEPDTTNHHPHHDIIIAWAKGAEVEFRAHPSAKWLSTTQPIWYASFEYRIKPTNPNADRIARIECELKRLADEVKELRDED